jgi:hypothetical protein
MRIGIDKLLVMHLRCHFTTGWRIGVGALRGPSKGITLVARPLGVAVFRNSSSNY